MKKEGLVSICIAVALVSALILLFYYAISEDIEYRNECEARGGQVLEARGMRVCIDPKALK